MQAWKVEQRIMNNSRFQDICYRQQPEQDCAPAFSFASFMHANPESLTSGDITLEQQCASHLYLYQVLVYAVHMHV